MAISIHNAKSINKALPHGNVGSHFSVALCQTRIPEDAVTITTTINNNDT